MAEPLTEDERAELERLRALVPSLTEDMKRATALIEQLGTERKRLLISLDQLLRDVEQAAGALQRAGQTALAAHLRVRLQAHIEDRVDAKIAREAALRGAMDRYGFTEAELPKAFPPKRG